jgi:hypothetical protein
MTETKKKKTSTNCTAQYFKVETPKVRAMLHGHIFTLIYLSFNV